MSFFLWELTTCQRERFFNLFISLSLVAFGNEVGTRLSSFRRTPSSVHSRLEMGYFKGFDELISFGWRAKSSGGKWKWSLNWNVAVYVIATKVGRVVCFSKLRKPRTYVPTYSRRVEMSNTEEKANSIRHRVEKKFTRSAPMDGGILFYFIRRSCESRKCCSLFVEFL